MQRIRFQGTGQKSFQEPHPADKVRQQWRGLPNRTPRPKSLGSEAFERVLDCPIPTRTSTSFNEGHLTPNFGTQYSQTGVCDRRRVLRVSLVLLTPQPRKAGESVTKVRHDRRTTPQYRPKAAEGAVPLLLFVSPSLHRACVKSTVTWPDRAVGLLGSVISSQG